MEPARQSYKRTLSGFLYDGVEVAEQKTLGMILWNPEKLEQVRTKLSPNDFRYEKHRLIFRAMLDLTKQNLIIDVLSLWKFLKERNELELAGGSSYITYITLVAYGYT